MNTRLSILLAAGLFLFPFAASAIDYGSQPSQTHQAPPVAQTLIREGDFAIKLAAALNLGLPADEASAEDMLARAGVVPLNGWISDYPVTPAIIGQLRESITRAAYEGRLSISAEEANRRLFALARELSLPTPDDPEIAAAEARKAPAPKTDPTIINNYYYNQGPPIVTYYPPPAGYAYLYDFVPYPSWYFGYWFPGFFISRSFTTSVVVSGAFIVGRPFIDTRIVIVSNRFIDPVTRVPVTVTPFIRTSTGAVRPITRLQTMNGRTYDSLTDLRRDAGNTRPYAVSPGVPSSGAIRDSGRGSFEMRGYPQDNYSRSMQGIRGGSGITTRDDQRRFIAPRAPMTPYRAPVLRGTDSVRPFVAPGAAERSINRQTQDIDRRFIPSRPGVRSNPGAVIKGDDESQGFSPYAGPKKRGSSGGAFPGSRCAGIRC